MCGHAASAPTEIPGCKQNFPFVFVLKGYRAGLDEPFVKLETMNKSLLKKKHRVAKDFLEPPLHPGCHQPRMTVSSQVRR